MLCAPVECAFEGPRENERVQGGGSGETRSFNSSVFGELPLESSLAI